MLTKERKNWNVKSSEIDNKIVNEIESALGVSAILSTLVLNRGYNSAELAQAFVLKSDEKMHDPFLLNDMEIGTRRILSAIESKEHISIFGDYDVDGVTSVSILYLYLNSLVYNNLHLHPSY